MVWCHEQDKKENNQNLVAEIGWQNWLFVWAEQNIYSGFTICRIYGGVMGDLTKIYTIIQPKMVWGYKKMGVITACKCKKITNDGCQKRNSKFFINFLCYFSNYVRPFWKVNPRTLFSSWEEGTRFTLRISNGILLYCSQFGLSLIKVK